MTNLGDQEWVGGRIVVGVDGSPSSLAALEWALGQAELTGASIDVVGAWGFPIYFGEPNLWPIDIDLESIVRHQLETALDRVVPRGAKVAIRVLIRRTSPAVALLEEARGAQLLVVGTKGHGELAEMLLGSVSLRCVAHAPCPVVVVRAPRPALAS